MPLLFTIDKWLPLVLGAGALVVALGVIAAILLGIYLAWDYLSSDPVHFAEVAITILVMVGFYGVVYLFNIFVSRPANPQPPRRRDKG